MDENIGRELHGKGWDQGVLFPPLSEAINFDPAAPVSKLAKAAARTPPGHKAAFGGVAHGVAYGPRPKTKYFLLITQACDLVKPLSVEPNVLAMPVFATTNEKILEVAARNSVRYFLVDAARDLIADALTCMVVEKPLLTKLTPEVGVATAEERRRLGQWVARRFNRPAIPDPMVEAIAKPILTNLRTKQQNGTLDEALLARVVEVRLCVLNDTLPYRFQLLFIVDEADVAQAELDLAPLVGELRAWFSPASATLEGWYARSYGDISVADYLDYDQLDLVEYSYDGRLIVGLLPPAAAP